MNDLCYSALFPFFTFTTIQKPFGKILREMIEIILYIIRFQSLAVLYNNIQLIIIQNKNYKNNNY